MPVQHIMPSLDREMPMMHRVPFMGQPDFRIHEMNRRLQQWTDDADNLWWDTFTTEFFEDDATLTLAFFLEDGLKRYTIGRTLIPRYFRSLFEGGVTELFFVLKHSREAFHNSVVVLDCEQASIVSHHTRPVFTKVFTEGRLVLEMTFDDLMRIRTWHFTIHHHFELVPRTLIAMQQQDSVLADHLSLNVTRQGLTSYTLNFLRLCVILEPMQELMSRHKAYGLNPRDCLKTTLFQKWQRMVAPPDANRTSNKKRKRKSTASNNALTSAPNSTSTTPTNRSGKRSPEPSLFNPMLGDVMVVGEPTLMGGEFGDKDERLISRLENSQYETNNDEPSDEHYTAIDDSLPSSEVAQFPTRMPCTSSFRISPIPSNGRTVRMPTFPAGSPIVFPGERGWDSAEFISMPEHLIAKNEQGFRS